MWVSKLPASAIGESIARLEASVPVYDAWFKSFDLILTPVLAKPAVELGYVAPTVPFAELSARVTHYVGYTPVHNVAGAAAMSVPLHWTSDGIPVGMHFAGRAGDERKLFELAFELEQAQPWAQRKPPVWFGG